MQSLGFRASRAGKFAGGCILLLALASTSAAAQAVSSGVFWAFSPPVAADDTREFAVIPTVGLLESFTDNVGLTPTGQKADFITRPIAGANVNVRSGFLTAAVSGHVFYDAYASQTNLSGLGADATGTASYVVMPDFLSIDAQGITANTNGSTFGTPATDRVGTGSRVQVSTYNIGPHLTTTIDDFADLDVVGRFAQVFYNRPNASTFNVPTGSTILEGGAILDTADRFRGYESVTNIQYARDDHNFEAYNGLQSFFVQVAPQIRLVGRGGYDDATQPGIVNIKAPMWSGGVEVTINQQSKITVETGERFNHAAWAADVHLQFSDAFSAVGRYTETLEPPQLQLSSSFVSFTTSVAQSPRGCERARILDQRQSRQPDIPQQAGEFHLIYAWEGQILEFTVQLGRPVSASGQCA